MPKLTLTLPDGSTPTIELKDEIVTVGRLPDNIIEIDDGSVSSHHAQLKLEGGDYHLKDLNSTNGCRINDTVVTDGQLQDGDIVRFGKIEAHYASEIPASRPKAQAAAAGTGAVVDAAAASQMPTNFSNASPFKTKGKRKDPLGMAAMAAGFIGIAAFLAAVAICATLSPS